MPKRSTRGQRTAKRMTKPTAKRIAKRITKPTAKRTANKRITKRPAKRPAKPAARRISRPAAKPPAIPTARVVAETLAPPQPAERPDREVVASIGELGRRRRDDSNRQAALDRGVFAKHAMRPRIAPRANSEKRRSGKRTVTTKARRRSH